MTQNHKTGARPFLCIILASLMVSACAYFEPAPKPEPEVEAVDLSAQFSAEPLDLADIIFRKTKGRVRYYGLEPEQKPLMGAEDGGAVDVAPVEAVPAPGSVMPEGAQVQPQESSVKVFSVQ